MTWKIFGEDGHGSNIDRPEARAAIARAVAERGKWSGADLEPLGLGPSWYGEIQRLNPLYAGKRRALAMGVGYVGLALLVVWLAASGPRGMVPGVAVSLLVAIGVFLGLPALAWGLGMPRYLPGRRWSLHLSRGGFIYELPAFLHPLVKRVDGWSVALDAVARVETAATAEWEPTRRGWFGDKPTPREEFQTFLFMADGSRRVVAVEQDGRESMARLAASIRAALAQVRDGRPVAAARVETSPAAASPEGFTL